MPAARLNNVSTANTYTDTTTAIFGRGRPGFTMDVNGAAVYYILAWMNPGDREPTWADQDEVFKVPSFNSFNDVEKEGLPPGTMFAGIKVRSAVANTPAQVTVA